MMFLVLSSGCAGAGLLLCGDGFALEAGLVCGGLLLDEQPRRPRGPRLRARRDSASCSAHARCSATQGLHRSASRVRGRVLTRPLLLDHGLSRSAWARAACRCSAVSRLVSCRSCAASVSLASADCVLGQCDLALVGFGLLDCPPPRGRPCGSWRRLPPWPCRRCCRPVPPGPLLPCRCLIRSSWHSSESSSLSRTAPVHGCAEAVQVKQG